LEEFLKHFSATSLICLLLITIVVPSSLLAQKKKPASTKKRPPAASPTPAPDMRAEAALVADQIKNVSRFLYIYGQIENSIEVVEENAKRGQNTPAVEAKNKQNLEQLVANIKNLRLGMDDLVKRFQGNPRLQVQSLKVSLAAESAALAEQLAAAGKFNDAGKALIAVNERLTDALISMRLQ
jgi:hypothetical protein